MPKLAKATSLRIRMFNILVREKVPYDKSITDNTNFVGESLKHLLFL